MSGNTAPIFAAVPNTKVSRGSTANSGRDGSGTIVDAFVAGANGSRCDRVEIHATGTTTAGMIRFYHFDGTNSRFLFEVPVTAITPSGTVVAFAYEWVRTDGAPVWSGPTTSKLQWSTVNAEQFDVVAFGGDF